MCSGTLGKVTGAQCRFQPASLLINREKEDSQVLRMFILAWKLSSKKWESEPQVLFRMIERGQR